MTTLAIIGWSLAIIIFVALIVCNVIWIRHADEVSDDWSDFCARLNKDWAELCENQNKGWSEFCDKIIKKIK